ncbi:MAG TPA: hypothetical protein VGA90_06175 [Methylomirabilota bacterium]
MGRPDLVELGRRLDEILAATERLIRPVPEAEMACLRDPAFQIFRLGLGFVDGMDRGRLAGDWRDERAPEDLRDGGAVARYGALVRGRVGGWFEGAGPRELDRLIDGPEGPRSGRELLEQVTDEAAAHLRLLEAALERRKP